MVSTETDFLRKYVAIKTHSYSIDTTNLLLRKNTRFPHNLCPLLPKNTTFLSKKQAKTNQNSQKKQAGISSPNVQKPHSPVFLSFSMASTLWLSPPMAAKTWVNEASLLSLSPKNSLLALSSC